MSEDFYKYISNIPVNDLLKIACQTIFNDPKLKILYNNHLTPFWDRRPNKSDLCFIEIAIDQINNLNFSDIEENFLSKIPAAFKSNNYLTVDSGFNIIKESYESSSDYLNLIVNNSKNNHIVFYLGAEGIDTCINGEIVDRINVFYREKDIIAFSKKYTIRQIEQVLKLYQDNCLNDEGVYKLFFADKSVIEKIDSNHHKNVLRNKPEKLFRDNLLHFLNNNTQHTFYKEIELQSSIRETDLFTEWEGRKYMIEVKWIGLSINNTADKFTTPFNEDSARKGVVQSLEYIRELINNMRISIKCGYLLVFDARVDKKEIDYKSFTNVNSDLKPFFDNHFSVLPKLNVTNLHPS